MKITRPILTLLVFSTLTLASKAQNDPGVDSTGLPGDNFSLQGALEMFKKASSPEEFEKMINTKDNSVNNLDLNDDGETDYVKVIDKLDKDAHAIVLQVAVSETENQDIAVIEIEKTGDEKAVLQIVGDEDIYGEEVIIEPNDEDNGNASMINENDWTVKGHGPANDFYNGNTRIIVNVWFWPAVRFMYAPTYVVWRSPWRWRYYPAWWRPWRPLAWHAYHPLVVRYHRPFVVVHTHRVVYAHRMYTPLRASSVTVRTRYSASVNNYRVTKTRTTVTGPRGNHVSRRTTTVKGPNGGRRMKSRRR